MGFWSAKLSTVVLFKKIICRVAGFMYCTMRRPCHRRHLLWVLMNVTPRRLSLPGTRMQKRRSCTVSRGGRGLHRHFLSFLMLLVGCHHEAVLRKYKVLWCSHTSQNLLLALCIGNVVTLHKWNFSLLLNLLPCVHTDNWSQGLH